MSNNRRVQIHFDNDEVLTVETAQISLTDPYTGQLTNVPLTNVDTARHAINEYEKQRNSNADSTGKANTTQQK
jgi:hypothetical protein